MRVKIISLYDHDKVLLLHLLILKVYSFQLESRVVFFFFDFQ